jgi:hypothetical protein
VSIALTLAVLGTWLLLAAGLSAFGAVFLHRLGRVEPGWHHLYCAVWTGFALLIASLMLWHFFLPVDERALFMFSSAAALALIIERRWFASAMRLPFSRPFAVAVIAMAIWTANHTLPPGGMDDYTYEFQTIRWFHDYPIVPGLANLHGRLGFNNSHHLLAAMLSAGIWKGEVNHLFNGFFILLACILLLDAIRDLAQGAQASLERSLFSALLLCPCITLVVYERFSPGLSTLKADVFVCAATVVLASLFLRWARTPPGATSIAPCATALLIGAVTPSVKISTLVFCGSIAAVIALRSLLQVKPDTARKRLIVGALAVDAVIAICFPIRGIVLSGYPFYPLTTLGFNVDWRVPTAEANAERAYVTSYARLQPIYDIHAVSGWQWVPGWVRSTVATDKVNLLLPIVLAAVCIPFFVVGSPRGDPRGATPEFTPDWAYATLAATSAVSLIVWFIEAPAGRFALGQAWILFASALSWAVHRQRGGWSWNALIISLGLTFPVAAFLLLYCFRISSGRLPIFVLFVFIVFWMAAFGCLRLRKPGFLAALCMVLALYPYGERSVTYIKNGAYRMLGQIIWINLTHLPHPAAPLPQLRQTRSGLNVYDTHFATYQTPLPNTRYFNPYLELRTARMQDGFRNSSPSDSTVYGETASFGYEVDVWPQDIDAARLALRIADKRTLVAVHESIIAGNRVLEPGTYAWELIDSPSGRNIVQIFNMEGKIEAIIVAAPNYRLQPTGNTPFLFWETPAGVPKAVRAWFYPGDKAGQQFAYPMNLISQLAAARPSR